MNADTKRHIDAARQVLVGVVPNPTSQIDQITNALIYKFMDDMDQAAIKAGGDPSFFVGELGEYSWTRIMDTKLTNQERMNIYSDALIKLSQYKQLPPLFRDVFKAAFLPYRNPEVLHLFLKEIGYFDYSHPEELGNAYEYLLSIMSSQGDAGQFRTPRHIIDFIVDVVNPTKDDKVLDPACGTGGFLISAYKHILEQHDIKNDTDKKGKLLTPDQKRSLMNNFEGYDIDPGMVRISQVNMYLHQFKNPKIVQYDTLSMEERWKNKFDVILANPPFMSPKGGIKPHSKFTVPSTRSEVLFADYIINHLSPDGRAGIIVPEGIIFQSGSSYKKLRENLINDGLYAVVSLPQGVFNPYAGVKTSILFYNNTITKKVKEILFIKIENDGFDLGAQRRPIDKDDLPKALAVLERYKKSVIEDKKFKLSAEEEKFSSIVKKEKISESGDYNLSADRYKVDTFYKDIKWPLVKISEISDIFGGDGAPQGEKYYENGTIPFVRMKDLGDHHITDNLVKVRDFLTEETVREKRIKIWAKGSILLPRSGSVYLNHRAILGRDAAVVGHIAILTNFSEIISNRFLFYLLLGFDFGKLANQTSGLDLISFSALKELKIPLPPIEIQNEIVAELDGYQKLIDGAKQIVENYKPTIKIDPVWEVVELGKITDNLDNRRKPVEKSKRKNGQYPYYGATGIVDYVDKYLFDEKLVLVGEDGAKWKSGEKTAFIAEGKYWVNNHAHVLHPHPQKILDEYLINILNQMDLSIYVTGITVPKLNQEKLRSIKIPLPPTEEQQKIIAQIKDEQKYVNSAKEMIKLFEWKIKQKISEVWRE